MGAVATVYHPDRLEYFIEALKYGLEGLKAYFDFIVRLFVEAITR